MSVSFIFTFPDILKIENFHPDHLSDPFVTSSHLNPTIVRGH